MGDLPLHPAVVHIPLGVAFLMPILVAILALGVRRTAFPRKTWLLPIVAQVVLVAGGFVGMQSGENEEDRAEQVVAKAGIHDHERAAKVFTYSAAGGLVILVAAAVVPVKAAGWFALLAFLASLGVAGMGAYAGHLGGKLVYRDGAAAAYAQPGKAAPAREENEHR